MTLRTERKTGGAGQRNLPKNDKSGRVDTQGDWTEEPRQDQTMRQRQILKFDFSCLVFPSFFLNQRLWPRSGLKDMSLSQSDGAEVVGDEK